MWSASPSGGSGTRTGKERYLKGKRNSLSFLSTITMRYAVPCSASEPLLLVRLVIEFEIAFSVMHQISTAGASLALELSGILLENRYDFSSNTNMILSWRKVPGGFFPLCVSACVVECVVHGLIADCIGLIGLQRCLCGRDGSMHRACLKTRVWRQVNLREPCVAYKSKQQLCGSMDISVIFEWKQGEIYISLEEHGYI